MQHLPLTSESVFNQTLVHTGVLASVSFSPSNPQNCRNKQEILEKGIKFLFSAPNTGVASKRWFKSGLNLPPLRLRLSHFPLTEVETSKVEWQQGISHRTRSLPPRASHQKAANAIATPALSRLVHQHSTCDTSAERKVLSRIHFRERKRGLEKSKGF